MRINATTDLQQLLEARAMLRAAMREMTVGAGTQAQSVEPFAPVHLSPEARARLAIQALSGLTPAQFNQAFVEMADAGILDSLFQFKLDDPELRVLIETVARVLGPEKAAPFLAILDPSADEFLPNPAGSGQGAKPEKAAGSAEIVELAKLLSRELTQMAAQPDETGGATRGQVIRAEPLRQLGNLAAVLLGDPAVEPPANLQASRPTVAPAAPGPGAIVSPAVVFFNAPGAVAETSRAAQAQPEPMAPVIAEIENAPTGLPRPQFSTARVDTTPLLRELAAALTPEILPGSRGELLRWMRTIGVDAEKPAQAAETTAFRLEVKDTPEIRTVLERVGRQGLAVIFERLPADDVPAAIRIEIPVGAKLLRQPRAAASPNEQGDPVSSPTYQNDRQEESVRPESRAETSRIAHQAKPVEEPSQEMLIQKAESARNSTVDRVSGREPVDSPAQESAGEPRVDRNDIPVGVGLASSSGSRARINKIETDKLQDRHAETETQFVATPRERALVSRPPAPLPARLIDVARVCFRARIVMVEPLVLPSSLD